MRARHVFIGFFLFFMLMGYALLPWRTYGQEGVVQGRAAVLPNGVQEYIGQVQEKEKHMEERLTAVQRLWERHTAWFGVILSGGGILLFLVAMNFYFDYRFKKEFEYKMLQRQC